MSRNPHKAALEYMNGCKARAEEQELSVRGLARKFKCSRRAVYQALDGRQPQSLSEEDALLIRKCDAYRQTLVADSPYRSKEQVARIHGVGVKALDIQLQAMGWTNPLTSRKEVAA